MSRNDDTTARSAGLRRLLCVGLLLALPAAARPACERVSLTRGITAVAAEPVGDTLYFVRPRAVSNAVAIVPEVAHELWKSDGTVAGTVPIKQVFDVPEGDTFALGPLQNVNGAVFFVVTYRKNYQIDRTELWKTNGTGFGTRRVSAFSGLEIDHLAAVGDTLFFSLFRQAVARWALWKSDGTETGTILVDDFVPGPERFKIWNLIGVGQTLFFGGAEVDDFFRRQDSGLWRSDGTKAGTIRIADVDPREPVALARTLLFVEGPRSARVWRSDGTAKGTKPLTRTSRQRSANRLTRAGKRAFFVVSRTDRTPQIWVTNGSRKGTRRVTTLPRPDDTGRQPDIGSFTSVGGAFVFQYGASAYNPADHVFWVDGPLWMSDGRKAHTGPMSTSFDFTLWVAAAGDQLFFVSGRGIDVLADCPPARTRRR